MTDAPARVGVRPWEWITLAVIIGLAALARFVNLATRGTWDGDQGHDMRVLEAFVSRGDIPLLGPPTSIGEFHHGALYYFLLSPSAALSGSNPTIVVAQIALAGVLAVAATWWLGRSIGGPVAGLVAAALMAVSATSIDGSTFIWNPNLIALSSSVTLVAAWQAWRSGHAAWWLAAAAGLAVTMQCHVLGLAFAPGIVALWIADVRRRTRSERGAPASAVRWGLAGIGLIVVSYLPLIVNELTTGFSETRAALDYLRSGGQPVALDPVSRLVFVALRVVAWPLTGLITNAFAVGTASAVGVVAILVWRLRAAGGHERVAVRWLGATAGMAVLILAFGISGLATVTPLPTDHYHAFLDPIVFVIVGLGAAAAWRRRTTGSAWLGPAAAVLAVAALVSWNVATWPPAVHPDGGWPAARAVAQRLVEHAGDRSLAVIGLPAFKPVDAYIFPLEHEGRTIGPAGVADAIAVVCDDLWISDCGGPAEDREVAALTSERGAFRLAHREPAGPRRTVSLYVRSP